MNNKPGICYFDIVRIHLSESSIKEHNVSLCRRVVSNIISKYRYSYANDKQHGKKNRSIFFHFLSSSLIIHISQYFHIIAAVVADCKIIVARFINSYGLVAVTAFSAHKNKSVLRCDKAEIHICHSR